MMGNDMRTVDAQTVALLTNADVIAINQGKAHAMCGHNAPPRRMLTVQSATALL